MDLPSYKFNEILEKSIQNVDTLAGKTQDYLKLVAEFGRTGKNDTESMALANTATILQNISDLNAEESFNSLTAAQIAFKIAGEDSITIANKLNEVDNNFAITTKDLALSMNKTAQSAATYGVSLDQLLGYTTAIGASTRETGSIVGNSLKTIFSRIGTLSKAQEALDAVGVSVRDSAGEMKDVSVIINDLGQKWEGLTKEQQTNTLVNVAGVHHQNRLAALMNNYSMAIDSTTTSMESQGSAMREQEIFATSLEGRINKLQNSWTGFASTAGDALLYDGIVVLTEIFKDLTNAGDSVVGKIGLLAPIFGVASTAVVFFSKSLRGMIVEQYALSTATIAQTGATGAMATVMGVASTATGLLTRALGLLKIALPVGLIIAGLGFAIEKLTGIISDNIQANEEFDTYTRKNTEALTTNKVAVEELLTKYNDLTKAKEYGFWDSSDEEKYLKVQQTLSEMFPALISHIDASGQAHLKTTAEINKEIEATNKLSQAQDQLTVDKAASTISGIMDDIVGDWNDSFKNLLGGSTQSQLESKIATLSTAIKNGAPREFISELEYDIAKLESQIANSMAVAVGEILKAVEALHRLNGVEIDSELAKSTEAFLRSLDLSDLDEAQFNKVIQDFAKAQEALQKAIETGNKVDYSKAVKQLNDLAKSSGSGEFKAFTVDFEKMSKAVKDGTTSFIDGEQAMDEFGETVNKTANGLYEFKDAAESLAGVTEEQINDTSELLWQYEMLTSQMQGYTDEQIQAMIKTGDLSVAEQQLVDKYYAKEAVMSELSAIYPDLLNKDGQAIVLSEQKAQAIALENEANAGLLRAYKLSREGKLNEEQKSTLYAAEGTKARLELIKLEMQALEELHNKRLKEAAPKGLDAYVDQFKANQSEKDGLEQKYADAVTGYSSSIDKLISSVGSGIDVSGRFTSAIEKSSKSTGKDTKSKKDNNKETEKSIFLANLYKQKIDELSLAIQKEISLREKLPDYDSKFTSSLETQINLQNTKLEVMRAQEASIQAQIKAGKIQTTGLVKESEAIKTINKQLSGYSGKITSKFGERADKHRGTDIAGKAGTGIDSFAGGKVVAAGYAGKKGAEKMHSSYGNVVVVQSDDGTKRLYAHMEKVLVKVGDQISAGTRIGTIGTTGTSSGNHLHYELTQNGKLVDSYNEVMQARKGITTTTGGETTEVANVQQSVDQAKSDLLGIQNDILAQEQALNELQNNLVESVLSGYEFRKTNYDKLLENSDNRLAKLNKTSKEYRAELDKQTTALNAKKKVNQDEMTQLKQIIDSGTLTEKVVAEYTETLHQLGLVNSEIDLSLKGIETSKLESYTEQVDELINKYSQLRDTTDGVLAYENVAINDLDTSSKAYTTTLERINTLMKEKQNINRQEITGLERLIANGELYGEALENAKKRVQELNTEIKQLQLDIQEGNFNILINIKTQSDAKIDDIQFEIDRAEALRKMYEEGSADYKKHTQTIIDSQQKIADSHLQARKDLEAELKLQDITIERRKEILEILEDEHLAWLNATYAVKDYNKQLENANKAQLEQIANDVISALKEAYQARRDDHIKLIDEELKRETEAHEKRKKQLNDELDLFRRNVEEKLRLIDRQEAERGYNMEIDEMEKERDKVQREINKLAIDDSYEAKKKRKQLQEQLDKIDKDIAEKRHQRDIELQKQGLNDLLESKENEIDGKNELEDDAFQVVVDRINREKEYWEKHYTDLLNDERKFARLREEILAGNFANVEKEFAEHIQYLKDSLPGLEDTLDGTMQAVGTSIRQNVIDNLQAAIDKMKEFNSTQISDPNGFDDGGYNPNTGNNSGGSDGSGGNNPPEYSKGNLSQGDKKVLLGKFLTDNVASSLSGQQKTNAHHAGNALGSAGRQEGSSIDKNISFDAAIRGLTPAELEELKSYFQSNINTSGGSYSDYIKRFLGISSGNSNSGNSNSGNNAKMLSDADMQVITAKYMNENLLNKTNDTKLRSSIKTKADALALQGRSSGSKIGGESYGSLITGLDGKSKTKLRGFMNAQANALGNQSLTDIMKQAIASLDTGGMLNFKGSGMDGKGGKLIMAHNGEVVNNPLETSQLLKTVDLSNSLFDKLRSVISPLLQLPTLQTNSAIGEESINITFGDIYNTSQDSAKNFARTIINDIKRTRG